MPATSKLFYDNVHFAAALCKQASQPIQQTHLQGTVVTTTHNNLVYHVLGVDRTTTLDSPMLERKLSKKRRKQHAFEKTEATGGEKPVGQGGASSGALSPAVQCWSSGTLRTEDVGCRLSCQLSVKFVALVLAQDQPR